MNHVQNLRWITYGFVGGFLYEYQCLSVVSFINHEWTRMLKLGLSYVMEGERLHVSLPLNYECSKLE
ncbi:MAG: hypothetical protein CR997_13370 [Acidobacteria bacterium]|nr:MAG: hypothetical protein CR997_13370 [Acidobacteriota bacterium]